MTPIRKLAVRADFSNSRISGTTSTSALWCGLRVRGTPKRAQALLASAILFFLQQAIVAQEKVHTDTTQTTVVAAAQPLAARVALPVNARSASDSTTSDSHSDTPLGSATATITGTVLDMNGALVPGATVVLNDGYPVDRRETMADDSAAFKFDSVKPGTPYEVSVRVNGFSSWTSPAIVLEPSQFLILNDIHLKMEGTSTSITVYGSTEEIAVEQVHLEEQQRVLGFIPNFYVVYDAANAAPLTTKLKFHLAMRVATDPITIAGVAFMSGIDQASDRPGYVQGWKGYGQRFGANAAGGLSDILIGGAILPSLLHQDPRYFYQGTGGTPSRLKHAISSPFICRGDNGHRQINFSSIGGDIGTTALSVTYFPDSDRSAGMVFTTFGITTAERIVSAIAQEFILPRFTSKQKRSK